MTEAEAELEFGLFFRGTREQTVVENLVSRECEITFCREQVSELTLRRI